MDANLTHRTAIAVTDLPKPLSAKWQALGDGDELLLSREEADAIRANMPAAVSVATAELEPAHRKDFVTAMGLLQSMPSASVSDSMGAAVMEAYRIAVGNLPGDLLIEAARRALKDTTTRGYRPSPPRLLAYVETEFDQRKRRLDRLKRIDAGTGKAAPPPTFLPPAIAENFVDRDALLADTLAKLDAGHAIVSGLGADPKPRAEPPGSGLRSPQMQAMAEEVARARAGASVHDDLDDDRNFVRDYA